jgi:hypothetical protein
MKMFNPRKFFRRFVVRSVAAWAFSCAVSAVSVAQQITCPVANPVTNTSASATNSLNPCTIQPLAIYTNAKTGTLENKAGSDLINNGGLSNDGQLVNDANATLTNNASLINAAGATLSNSGVFVGTGTTRNYGTLNNLGSGGIINVIDNFGGTINNSGLSVYLASGSDVQGGTLKSGIGSITAWGNNVTLDGSTSFGALTIQGTVGNDSTINTTTNFEGTINNEGKIVLSNAFGGNANVYMVGNTTLQGGGTVTLSGGIIQNGPGSLTNVNNTIQGSGFISPGAVTFANQGTVNANVSGGALALFAYPVNNTGVIEATGGGTLEIILGTVNNNSGGSIVTDASSTIQNSALLNDNAGGKIINAGTFKNDGALVNNAEATISNSGVFVGAGATQNYGTLNNLGSGGIINVIDNFGGTINNSGLSVYLASGSDIQGGTLKSGSGSITAWGNNVTLDGSSSYGTLTIQGTVGNDSTIGTTTNFEGTINNEGRIVLSNAFGGIAHVSLVGNTTLEGGGTVTLMGGNIQNGSGSLTNVNNTIQGSGSLTPGNVTFNNQGTINANVSGGGIQLFALPLNNTGVMEATHGGLLVQIEGTINNNSGGSIISDASSMIETGALNNNAGGKIINAGTFKNEGTLVNNAGATISNSGILSGGIIQNYGTVTNLGSLNSVVNNFGGTITTSNGAILGSGSDIQGGTLNAGSGLILLGNNVTLGGSGGFGALTLEGEIGITPIMATTLYMNGTINNEGTIQLDGATSPITLILNGNTTLQGGGTVRLLGGAVNALGGGILITTQGAVTLTNVNNTIQGSGLLSVGFVNEGTVDVTPGQTLTFLGPGINNNSGGSIISNAGSTIVVDTALNNNAGAKMVNAGTLQINAAGGIGNGGSITNTSGAILLNNGPYINEIGSTLNNYGAISNSLGATMLNSGTFENHTGSSLVNSGELITSGQFSNDSGASLTTSNVLENGHNLSNGGTLEIKSGGSFINDIGATIVNSGTLQNDSGGFITNYGAIVNNKGATFINDGSFFNEGGSSFVNNGTFTLGKGSSFTDGGAFTNTGTVNVDPGATLSNPGGYVQHGGQTVVDGTLNSKSVEIQGGTFSGMGTVTGSVLNSGGIFQPGGNGGPGTLVVEGYEQQSGAIFDELIDASGNGALVAVTGGIQLDSGALLDIDLLNGFKPTDGETFDIMGALQISGAFANAPTTGFEVDGFDWTITYDPGEIVLDAVSPVSGGTPPTPEPSSVLLLALGGLAVAAYSRRKRAALAA